ncbi:YncE family protein, partial [candidate division TA06 bacterium]
MSGRGFWFTVSIVMLAVLVMLGCSKTPTKPNGGNGSGYPSRVVDTIAVGKKPWGVACFPGGSYVYVTNYGDDNVSVIRTIGKIEVDTIQVGECPRELGFTPNGHYVYVANWKTDNVSVIQILDNRVVATVPVGREPHGIGVHPSGDRVYVPNSLDNSGSV